MAKKNKVAKTTIAAALVASAVVPVAVAPVAAAADPVNEVVYEKDGKLLSLAFETFTSALNAEVLTDLAIKYVKAADGNYYLFEDFTSAINATETLAEALETLTAAAETLAQELSDVVEADIDEDGNVVSPGVEPTPVPELAVESVSAITTTTVDVAITAAEEDVLGATVEVKDNNGNVVEVNPVDISAGDTVASFTFKTAVKAEDLVGVWTVDGKEYNLDAVKQLNDITEAASATPFNEVKLYNALTAAGIKNVDDNRVAAYRTAIVDASPEALADVQKAVDATNEKAGETANETAAVKAVEEATNQIQLLAALEANFDRVNADWIAAYASGKEGTAAGSDSQAGFIVKDSKTVANTVVVATGNGITETAKTLTFDNIQDVIDTVNTEKITKAVNDAAGTLDSKKIAEARTLVTAYAEDAKEGELNQKDATLDALKFEDALIAVDKATTNNSLKKALTDLDALEDAILEKYKGTGLFAGFTKKFDLEEVRDNLLADYRTELSETEAKDKNGRGDLNAIITKVNDAADLKLINAVKNADSADALLKALKAYPGLKQVADTNKAAYWNTGNTYFTSVNDSTIQGVVDTRNLQAVTDAKVASNDAVILDKLNVFGIDNVVVENAAAYKSTLVVPSAQATNKATVEAVKNAVKAVNDAQGTVAAVTEINKATTVTEVKTALDKLAITSYVNVPTADKLHIAEQVLEVRNGLEADRDELKADGSATDSPNKKVATAKTFASVTDLTGHLDKAVSGVVPAYNTLVSQFTAANLANKDISVAITQLNKLEYSAFDNLSAGEKAKVAEIITSSYPVDGEGDPVDYKTLSAVKKAIDEAIAAPAPASAE